MILAVGNDQQFVKFCTVAQRPDLARDPRFVKNQDRVRHRGVLIPILEALLLTRNKADWLAHLEAAKVPCGAINNLAEVFADPHVVARNMVDEWQHPLQPGLRLAASPMKFSATPVLQQRPPPLLGQHTDEVLREVLGQSDSAIAALRRRNIV